MHLVAIQRSKVVVEGEEFARLAKDFGAPKSLENIFANYYTRDDDILTKSHLCLSICASYYRVYVTK